MENNTKQSFSIGEIAELLNISTSKLRFWEKKGLFSITKSDNHYRTYSYLDLIQIADLIFYRNLGVPVNEVCEFANCSTEEYDQYLLEIQAHLSEKIKEYQKMYLRTLEQRLRLQDLNLLQGCGPLEEEIPFSAVAPFDFLEKDKMRQYIQNPSLYVWYLDTRESSEGCRGIITSPQEYHGSLLWKKKHEQTWMTFLVRARAEEDYAWDAQETLNQIKCFHSTGIMLARHLLTAFENGKQIEYLKAYVEILDDPPMDPKTQKAL